MLGCLAAWKDEKFCRAKFAYGAAGEIDQTKLNVDGGADRSLGHPVGTLGQSHRSAPRQRDEAAGHPGAALPLKPRGQGGAMLIETV